MSITIQSGAFKPNDRIPRRHTGDGDDVSPPLSWANVPSGAKELALICDDPDAPRADPWVHWLIYKLPAGTTALPEGVATSEKLDAPAGAMQGRNSWGMIGYRGPAPPKGHGTHHYHFKLYALDASLDAKAGLDKDALLAKMKGHILAEGEVIGTYSR
jgi:Raf kinase inhibitor-like YbhB/YbcL family protein